MKDTTLARFWAKIEPIEDRSADDCWIWSGAKIRDGYGAFKVDGQVRLAQAMIYLAHLGKAMCKYQNLENAPATISGRPSRVRSWIDGVGASRGFSR